MAYISNYNPSIHDLYTYNSGPTIDPQNYSNNQQVTPISYNNSLYIKDSLYGLPLIDFSGIAIRDRGAPSYGFDTYVGQPGVQPSGIKIDPSTQVVSFPSALNQFGKYAGGITSCYYPGCPSGDYTIASNYNYWNNGQYALVLISPKHVIAIQHYVGSATQTTVRLLGKNNTVITKLANKVIDLRLGPTPPGYDWPASVGNNNIDFCVFELQNELTPSELSQVKIYKFLNNYQISDGTPSFYLSPQGAVIVKDIYGNLYFNSTEYPNAAEQDFVPGTDVSIWAGDSGTPVLVYVPRIDETCFFGLAYHVNGIYDNLLTPVSPSKQFFDALKEYIVNNTSTSYEIELVNYTANPTPPVPPPAAPYPESLYINGKTYYVESIIDPIPGSGNTYNFYSNFEAGYTYSFALIAYNKNGISQPVITQNVYIPPS